MSEPLSQRIVELLSAYTEPLTASFISFNLNDCSFEEICDELAKLQEAEVVSLDYSGYLLRQDRVPQADETSELAPAAVSEESESEGTARPLAPDTSEESEPDRPANPLPFVAPILQLDEQLSAFIGAHWHKTPESDSVENDEPPETDSTLASETPEEAGVPHVESIAEAEVTPDFEATPEVEASPDIEAAPDVEASPYIEAMPDVEASPATEVYAEVVALPSDEAVPNDADSVTTLPAEDSEANEPILGEASDDEPLMSLHGEASDRLGERPTHPDADATRSTIDEVDREYRMMLEQFSHQDSSENNDAENREEAPSVPVRHRTQEADEYRELLAMLFFDTPDSVGGETDAKADADDSPSSTEEQEEPVTYEVLNYHSPVTALRLSGRPLNTFLRYDIDTIGKLVREIDGLHKKPGVGFLSFESTLKALNNHAISLPSSVDAAQQLALCEASGSRMFVFDILGRLCHVELPDEPEVAPVASEEAEDDVDEFAEIKALPIDRLTLTPQLRGVLWRRGCRTVGLAVAIPDEELLAERGIGYGTILRFRDSIDELGLHEQPHEASSNPGESSILLEDTTPLSSIDLPNRLKHALSNAGYRTLGEVAALTEEEELFLRGVGVLAAERLNEVLLEFEQAKASRLLEAASLHSIAGASTGDATQEPEVAQAALTVPAGDDALRGIQQALEICRQRQYPIYEPSFSVCMPLDVVQSIGVGHSADEYRDSAIEVIEGSDDLIAACEDALRLKVDRARLAETNMRMAELIPIPPVPEWEEAAKHMAKADEWCLYHEDEHSLELRHPSLDDWIESSVDDDRDKALLRMYLSGYTLQECGDKFDLSRERVRQIASRRLKEVALVEEDRYRYLFDNYALSKNEFLSATGEPLSTYLYLNLTGTQRKRRLTLSKALRDELLPQAVREGVRRILDTGYMYANGARIPIRREDILTHVVMQYASDRYIKTEELNRLYKQLLKDNHLEKIKSLQYSSLRNLEACIDRYEQIMRLPHNTEIRFGGSIRYYDAPSMDFDPLRKLLASGILGDVECSAAMLVGDERFESVLEKLDIRNGYELHYILGRYCDDIEGMTMGRSPNVSFGAGNRHDQILELIKELSPASSSDLAKAYEKRYGVDVAVFQGSYLGDFRIYLKNGKYVYNDQGFGTEQKAFVRQQLNGIGRDYVSTALIKARFKDRFPEASTSLINAENLAGLGFHPSAGLLIRNGVDERVVFGELLDSKQRFSADDEELGKDVFDNPSFRAELAIRERAYRLVEYEKGRYLSTKMFASLDKPLYEDDLKDYVEQALDHMVPNRPYTVQSLVASGFRHKLDVLRDDFDLGDYFYASLLATGTVGGRLKTTSLADVPVFCRTMYGYSAPVMLEQILSAVEAIDIDELSYLLEDEYGISANNALLRMIAKRADLYYSESLDMVFDSVETYKRKAHEWIS